MALLHLRVVCPQEVATRVAEALGRHTGVLALRVTGESSHGWEVTADVVRESANDVLHTLHRLGVRDDGMFTLSPLDTAVGSLVEHAEREARGLGADALVWDELVARTDEDAQLTGAYLAFIVLATVLGGIGVINDSSITIVGAMVIGPEFGPLANLAVGIVRRRSGMVRRSVVALLVGFPVAIVVAGLLTLLARAVGLVHVSDISHGGRQTEFIYHPGWFSLIIAVVAGAAGMLSLTSSKSSALVGVFISVTTIPAAGNAAVGAALERWDEAWLSLAQLGINLVGIVAAGIATLALLRLGRAKARDT